MKTGRRSVAWPADEIDQILNARVAGAGDAEIRVLVRRLMAGRVQRAGLTAEGNHAL